MSLLGARRYTCILRQQQGSYCSSDKYANSSQKHRGKNSCAVRSMTGIQIVPDIADGCCKQYMYDLVTKLRWILILKLQLFSIRYQIKIRTWMGLSDVGKFS